MSRMNMAISHIALEHVSQWKRLLLFWFSLSCCVCWDCGWFCWKGFWRRVQGNAWDLLICRLCHPVVQKLYFYCQEFCVSVCISLHSRTLRLYVVPPSGQLIRTTRSGDFRPQIMKGIWKKCKCKELNFLIMLNDFTFNMHLNSNICNANVCMTWTPKESMCRPFDTAIRLVNAEPPL